MARKAGKGRVFTITGVDEIRRAYRTLPKRAANKVISKAIRAALKPVKKEVERRAPKGKTGLLARSFKVRVRTKKKRGIIALDVRNGEGDFKGKTYYAAMVNFGTKKQKAQGFMEAAFDATKDSAAAQVANEVAAGIVREAIAAARG